MSKSPRLVVRNVLMRDGKVLLGQRRSDDLWELPGGKVKGERVIEAAHREQVEECEVNLQGWPTLIGYVDDPGKVELLLKWTLWDGLPCVSRSHINWGWFPIESISVPLTDQAERAITQISRKHVVGANHG